MAAKTILSRATCTMTRPPARLATISSPRSRSWAAAVCAKTEQTKKHRHSETGKLDKRGFLKMKFIVVYLDAENTPRGRDERPGLWLPFRGGRSSLLRVRQKHIEGGAIIIPAIPDHGPNFASIGNVFDGIRT